MMNYKRLVFARFSVLCISVLLSSLNTVQADLAWLQSDFQGKKVAFALKNKENLEAIGWQPDMGFNSLLALMNNDSSSKVTSNKTKTAMGFLKQYGLVLSTTPDPQKALEYYTSDDCRQDPLALCNAAMIHIENQQYDQAEHCFKEAANQGSSLGQFCLADIYFYRCIKELSSSLSPPPLMRQAMYEDDNQRHYSIIKAWDLLNQAVESDFPPAKYLKAKLLVDHFSELSSHCDNLPFTKSSPQEQREAEIKKLLISAAENNFGPALFSKAKFQLNGGVRV